MKKLNSTSEFSRERNMFLLTTFREHIRQMSQITIEKAFKATSQAPAPRFWVSEERAAAVMGKMLSGADPTPAMNPEKREMYRELFAVFMNLKRQYPDESIASLCSMAVNSAAPASYLSWHTIRNIVSAERRRLRSERRNARSEAGATPAGAERRRR